MRKKELFKAISGTAAAVGDFWMRHFGSGESEPFDLQARTMFEEFADQMACMIYRCEVSPLGLTRVTYTNRAVEWIYEMTPEELKDSPSELLRRLHPDDYERIWAALFESHMTGKAWHEQYRVILPKKGIVWREARATVRKLEDGSTIWHGFIWDISSEKADEDKRKEFLAMVGHELRTPLTGVIGYTELLLDTHLDEEQRELLDALERSGEHMLRLVNDLMDMSKLEAGHFRLNPTPISLEEVCLAAIEQVRAQALERSLTLHLDTTRNYHDACVGDRTRIVQILTNLLSNAIKHGAKNRVFIRVRSVPMSDHPGILQVVVSVEDDGPGVPAGDRVRIFRPYEQLGEERRGSTGLGLPLARQLARRMEGEISVADSAEGGARFDLALLLPKAPPNSDENLQSRSG